MRYPAHDPDNHDVSIERVYFLSGMYPKTNSRNCTCQQSSVNRRDQRVCMTGSMQDMSANMHEFRVYLPSRQVPFDGLVDTRCATKT